MKKVFERIGKFIKKNEGLILVLVTCFLVILAGYFIYNYLTKEKITSVYISPVGNDLEDENDWDQVDVDADYDDDSGEYLTYLADVYDIDEVSSILSKFGVEAGSYQESDGVYYWNLEDGGFASFISNKSLFSLSTQHFKYNNSYGSFSYEHNVRDYIRGFLMEYFGIEQEIQIE